MIVVADTSPLTNLAAIGELRLLPALFGRIETPSGVTGELGAGGVVWPGRAEVESAPWMERHEVRNRHLVLALRRDLGVGEAEAIALALELGAKLVLMDEREGRRAAQRFGLRVMGVVGVLLQAKSAGLLTAVEPALRSLRAEAGFYLSDAVFRQALDLAGE